MPADGYYEWDEKVKPHRPHYFQRAELGGLLGFAGLWETWRGPDGQQIDSVAIITRDADAATRPVHDRMPRLLAPAEYEVWLEAANVVLAAAVLDRPITIAVRHHPVSARVNRVAQDDAANIAGVRVEAANDADPPPARPAQKRKNSTADGGSGTQGALF